MITLTAGVTATGCLEQDVTQVERPVQTRTVELHVTLDSAGQAAAQALGWSTGVPDIDVTVAAEDSAQTIIATGGTNVAGLVRVGPLEPASYEVSFTRLLTSAERERLSNSGATSVEGFARRARVRLGDFDTASVVARTSVRGSLLMSEWAFFSGYYSKAGDYETGGFLELYNNADTTVYLDGLLIGAGFLQAVEYTYRTCSEAEAQYLPETGVWADEFDRFPGRGTDYPVAPGQAVVIATDAVDHRSLFPNALDLRDANFEFTGPSDVDNPAVPNMIALGPIALPPGHGQRFPIGGVVLLLRPLDVDALPRTLAAGNHEYRLIPASAIIDIGAIGWPLIGYTPCNHVVNPAILLDHVFDRFDPDPFVVSLHRRVLYEQSTGRKVLMNTRASRTELVPGQRTPGVVP
ncbi:MAG TPA: DUF4876 domain-containing protein [Gemmatimonadaceae bacterium]|nr:DUF4876 domain-containing protein [Gemmatimonadaceae bacterium]